MIVMAVTVLMTGRSVRAIKIVKTVRTVITVRDCTVWREYYNSCFQLFHPWVITQIFNLTFKEQTQVYRTLI